MVDDGSDAVSEEIVARSVLFVPAHRPDLVRKAVVCGADAVVLDLEDATPRSEKAAARAAISGELPDLATFDIPFLVRINGMSHPEVIADIECAVGSGAAGILLPKVESPVDVVIADRVLSWFESRQGREQQMVLVPLLESGSAVQCAHDIAISSARVALLGWTAAPGGDLAASVGFSWSGDFLETLVMRSNVLLAARAAAIANPVCGVWTDIDDLEGLRRFARQNQQLGYEGMYAIHPSHIRVINEVFTPSASEIDRDRGVLAALEAADQEGAAVVIYEGAMVDEAMAAAAKRRLARANVLTAVTRR